MDSWSYVTSVFLPNGNSLLLPCDSFPEIPTSMASNELDKDKVFMSCNGFSPVSTTKVASSSKLSRINFKFRSFMDCGNYDDATSSRDSTLPAKKLRPSSDPMCQVHGCNMDLSSSKDYHKRHRVCEAHSKTSVVIVNGIEQRFCQQCSRFHYLSEFDNGKRSCRRRLAGHNERRRKPSFYFLPGKQRHKLLPQGRLMSFKDEPMFPPAQDRSYYVSKPTMEASGVSSSIWDLHEAAPPRSTCAHSLLSAHQSQQQHLSETPDKSFSITRLNQTLNASRIDYHQMQPFLTNPGNNTKGSSTVDLLQLSSHLQRIEQQQINFTNDVKQEYNNELYFHSS